MLPQVLPALSLPDGVSDSERELADLRDQLLAMQEELDATNRGVVALYAELDDQAEELRRARQRSESKFRAIYEQSPSGIALLDAEGRIAESNPAMGTLLGRDGEELQGKFLRDLASAEWTAALDRLSVPGAPAVALQEIPMQRRDGSVVHLEWSMTPDVDASMTMATATNVSQRVELERLRAQWLEREQVARGDAEHGSRMKDDFISVLAHELRTPLNAIVGWAQVLKRRVPDDLQRGVDAIDRNCATQARMISDLLDMSRLRLGKLSMTFVEVDPAIEIGQSTEALRPTLSQNDLTLEVVVQGLVRPIQADASRLQQVIWNLLTNAIKFTPRGGIVRILIDEFGSNLRVSVTDSGEGIPADFLPFVFDRFAQSDAGTNRQRGGLGLGLAIVKQIVEAHSGSVGVESPGPGLGATFTVLLPIVQSTSESALGAAAGLDAANSPLSGLDLLVVDDDDEAAQVLAVVLVDRGATARVATDADSALSMIGSRRPHALVSDSGMPGKDGYALIREIRLSDAAQGARRLPAIALTAFTREQDRQQALDAGFDAHCAKPLRPLEVVRQILMLVEEAS